ncbi:manganese efflux pump MntP family protein [uncultured Ruthenibacterium sp.]|uniref:manganese efflux pump MntP n=1 Tax=uncultured Ruthenibacterium sp. TaxID=1905347 RepID=UPI00349E633F
MDLMTLFVLALGLSMDAFAVSISNTMCFTQLRRRQCVAASLSFGIFQGVMPTIGFFAGRAFAGFISSVDHWVAFVLLALIGGNMVREAIEEMRKPEECPLERNYTFKMMLAQAVATSIDALAVGVSLAALNVNIVAAAGFIAGVTFVCCLVGHFLGRRFGSLLGKRAEILGGLILIGIGLKILIEHLSE